MSVPPEELDAAIADWLEQKEDAPGLLPGEFAARLPEPLRAEFLAELEALADLDQLATGSSPRDLPVRFGDFRVLGEIGRGAMGAVFEAEQVSSGRRVALKVLHPHIAGQPRAVSRLRREAATAASLDHLGIVPVVASGDEGGSAWLAMELVEGRSLQRLIAARDDARDVDHDAAVEVLAAPERLATVLAEIADALTHAHTRGVVHRDVKPANLMLRDDGGIAVLDFGLATARDAAEPELTRTGDFLGTPLYMAPEQAIGAENGTASSDVYALGAVLYECLTGQPPVPPGPLAKVIDSILNADPPDPRQLNPGVTSGLARIAMQCLEKEPARRYASAAALAVDLRRYAAGAAVAARPSGWRQRLARQMRRRPRVAALTVAAALLAVAATVAFVYSSGQAAANRDLQRAADLRRIPELLGSAPERITVFGGASLRFYASVGLGAELPPGPGARSARATAALAIGEQLVQQDPDDAAAHRALAMALLDVGDDPRRTQAAIEALLALPAATPGDRAMAAVFAQLLGKDDESQQLLQSAGASSDPGVAFWLGLWHQHRQDYFAAITAFDRALSDASLDDERRYFAFLHRGWCRTCPDVLQLRAAEDDLLQAAALRPAYGTARLLWAALRCLDPEDDLSRPVTAVGEVLQVAAPWVTVLTARVLLGIAEGGTWQAGPVRFGAEFSPIAAMPVAPDRAAALAGLALQLLDGVLAADPGDFGAAFARIAALTCNRRHAEAIALCDELMAAPPGARRALLLTQRARVHLAAGRAQVAQADATAALAIDAGFVAGWRLLADIGSHLGDLRGEAAALAQATERLATARTESCVYPDSAALLPELRMRHARVLLALGQRSAALDLLERVVVGRPLAGFGGARVRSQHVALVAAARGDGGPIDDGGLPASSPLQWLRGQAAPGAGAAMLRGWVPDDRLAGIAITEPATANLRLARGEVGILDAGLQLGGDTVGTPAAVLRHVAAGGAIEPEQNALPLTALLPHVTRILATDGGKERLLELAAAQLQVDPKSGEARLLRGAVLFLAGQTADAARFLDNTLDQHPDDLRARYLLAAAALSENDRSMLRRALERDSGVIDARALDAARAVLHTDVATTGQQLVDALE